MHKHAVSSEKEISNWKVLIVHKYLLPSVQSASELTNALANGHIIQHI